MTAILAAGILMADKASVFTLNTTILISIITMTTTHKIGVAAIITLAAGLTIYQIQKGPDAAREKTPGQSMDPAVSHAAASSRTPDASVPQFFAKPRLNEDGKRILQQDTGGASSEEDGRGGYNPDQLVALAARDPEAAMKYVGDDVERSERAELLGAVAAGILLHDGKDAMWRFLNAHQQDEQLGLKYQGELEKYLFRQLGREDTFDMAMEILHDTMKSSTDAMHSFLVEHHLDPQLLPKDEMELEEYLHDHLGREDTFDEAMKILADTANASMMAGSMLSGIEGAQNLTKAIDYMESKGIPVDFDYWSHQGVIKEDPRYWADWALQRDTDMLHDIVDCWARANKDEAKAWVAERVPKDDKRRADIDEMIQNRDEWDNRKTDQEDMDQEDTDKEDMDPEDTDKEDTDQPE